MTTWVFLRGLTRDSRHWGEFVATFQKEITGSDVVALDLPGNGVLNHLSSPKRVEDMSAWCRAELSRRGIAPPYHVLAMSLGAMVAIHWAQRHPDELCGCVLINSSLRSFNGIFQRLRPANYPALIRLALLGGSDEEWEKRILSITSRRTDLEPVLPIWVRWRREQPVSRANAMRQLLAAMRFRASDIHLAPPTLVLASVQDALVSPACSREIVRRWQTSYAEHPSAGHDIPLDDGSWVAQQIGAWLSGKPLQSASERTVSDVGASSAWVTRAGS